MKKRNASITTLSAALLALLALVSTGAQAQSALRVAATAVPHAEILEHVKPALAKDGVALEV